MKKTLQCHSKGDKRFSALCAKVEINGVKDTIENFYQGCKRDIHGEKVAKGQPVDHIVWKGVERPSSDLTPLYEWLWRQYFTQNPQLLVEASNYDEFVDIFKGRSINCQADVIRKIVLEYKAQNNKEKKEEEKSMKTAYSVKQLGYYLGQGEKDIECVFKLYTIDDVVFMYGVADNFNFYQKGKLFSPETIKQAAIKKLAELTKENKTVRFPLETYRNKEGILVKKLKPWTMKCVTIRDMICNVSYEEFETTVLDDAGIDYECYSVVSQEGTKKTVRYKVYTVKPEFQGVVVETKQFNEVVKGVVINGKTCQPIVEKVKGLTFRVTTLDGRVVDVDYKKVRTAWEANRLRAANEAEAYRIAELGEEVSFEDKLAFVLMNHNPIEVIDRNKITTMMDKVLSLDLDPAIKAKIAETEFEENTINALFNYLGDIKLDTAEYVDKEVVERLYEEVKPTYYGNANLLEAVVYNDEIM